MIGEGLVQGEMDVVQVNLYGCETRMHPSSQRRTPTSGGGLGSASYPVDGVHQACDDETYGGDGG